MTESRRLLAVQTPIIPTLADLIRDHPGTLSFGQGVVGYGPPPGVADAVARFFATPGAHKYQPVAGCDFLRDALAEHLARARGLHLDHGPSGSRLTVTAGGNNAFLAALLALCEPGDEVILPTPYYFNHEMAVTMAGCRPVLVPTGPDLQPDPAALAAAIGPRTRAVVTVSPNNPAGTVYPAATLRAINDLCAARGLCHLSDEVYSEFTYDGAVHVSPAAFPGAAAHTVVVGSLSKSHGLASWRIGWLVHPAPLENALRKIQDTFLICPPVVSQYAAAAALAAGPDWLETRLAPIRAVRQRVLAALAPLVRDGLVSIPPAAGAFYFFLQLHAAAHSGAETASDLTLAERLIREHRVAALPGSAFGPSRGPALRLAYGALAPETADEALGRFVHGLRALLG